MAEEDKGGASTIYTLGQLGGASTGAHAGSDLARDAKKNGMYPLLVIGGIIALIAIFWLLAKMKRDD